MAIPREVRQWLDMSEPDRLAFYSELPPLARLAHVEFCFRMLSNEVAALEKSIKSWRADDEE